VAAHNVVIGRTEQCAVVKVEGIFLIFGVQVAGRTLNPGRAVERTTIGKVARSSYTRGCVNLDVLAARKRTARVHKVIADDIYIARPVLASHVGLAVSDYIALDRSARTVVVDKDAVVTVAAVGGKVFDMHVVVIDIDSASTRDVDSVARVCGVVASAGTDVRVFNSDVSGVYDIHAVTAGSADPEPGIGDVALAINHEGRG